MTQVWLLYLRQKWSWHRRYSNVRLAHGKAEHLVLSGTLHWQFGEASNAHSLRTPAVDGRFD
jgi:hypothetical protein